MVDGSDGLTCNVTPEYRQNYVDSKPTVSFENKTADYSHIS